MRSLIEVGGKNIDFTAQAIADAQAAASSGSACNRFCQATLQCDTRFYNTRRAAAIAKRSSGKAQA
jgi:hypothetical protein